MSCQRCGAQTPDVAYFCQVCGLDLRSGDTSRRKSFAVKPDEPVASFNLISTIMPRGAGQRPQTYRIALGIGIVVALVAAIFGALPVAILVAAFTIPIVYIVYLYDVNLWEDEPVLVTVAAFLLTGVLALAFTIGWTRFRPAVAEPPVFGGGTATGPGLSGFLLAVIAVPIIAQVLTQLGPVYLASRPKFDDLMDGLTFGVISGVAYSTFDTLVRHSAALFGGLGSNEDPATWVALIFLEGLVKPLIMGTAAGIAAAEFSGLGRGYDGFTLRYARGFAEAVLANIAYAAGAYLFSYLSGSKGVILTLLWGVIILGALILRVRNVLHTGLMEAALEAAARSDAAIGAAGELQFCAVCEMPLVAGAAFCNACGTAVRIGPRSHVEPAAVGSAPPSATAGPPPGQSSGPAPAMLAPGAPEPHPSSQPTPPKPGRGNRTGTDQEGQE
ncbi:PrsW family intramembrane metalloprotease [Microlunatus sp. Gsoil 973]|uniref:PrsW family intramembrane metalloprotease n=1 Tax=Microlunatus sp. Gsoil 973 TaxID=2672569 RepID=UPI0018A869D4|nr:PrsW family intramembrane metalloprotease [Microlunatus sp. Gsoil 973]